MYIWAVNKSEQVLRQVHGSVTSRYRNYDRPTDQLTDMMVHRQVTLQIKASPTQIRVVFCLGSLLGGNQVHPVPEVLGVGLALPVVAPRRPDEQPLLKRSSTIQRWEFIKENKKVRKTRKQELDQESDQKNKKKKKENKNST